MWGTPVTIASSLPPPIPPPPWQHSQHFMSLAQKLQVRYRLFTARRALTLCEMWVWQCPSASTYCMVRVWQNSSIKTTCTSNKWESSFLVCKHLMFTHWHSHKNVGTNFICNKIIKIISCDRKRAQCALTCFTLHVDQCNESGLLACNQVFLCSMSKNNPSGKSPTMSLVGKVT